MKFFSAILASFVAAASAAPQALLPAGVDPSSCVNYPFCNTGAPNLAVPGAGFQFAAEQRIKQQQFALSQPIVPQVPGLAAHFAAEAQVLAKQGRVPGSIVHAGQTARVQQAEADLIALQQQQASLFL